MTREKDLQSLAARTFEKARVPVVSIRVRSFPGEHIVVVEVPDSLEAALKVAEGLDRQISDGFVTVRKADRGKALEHRKRVESVRDPRVTSLLEMLDARSRTSEAQPSLRYVSDVEGRLNVAIARRHHLIFGRRGVGKTALMLETKRLAADKGAVCLWVNVYSIRHLGAELAFLTLASRLCELPDLTFGEQSGRLSARRASALQARIDSQIGAKIDSDVVSSVVPELQQMMAAFCAELQNDTYVFLDDMHYLARTEIPRFLDLAHGFTRDNPVWLKVAGIKHQMRWYAAEAQAGMQIGHDATEIDLDITLQEPARAKAFLQELLDGYVEECDARPRSGFLAPSAIDRLVLASGGVPRDFATLCASAIQSARKRANARVTGVQDVNEAAGQAAKAKLRELEDDAASEIGGAKPILGALQVVRDFLLTEKQITFLRVDFIDKEHHPEEYALTQSLMDSRMLHLVNASVSEEHLAGHRSEVYLLDLSQYSGARLKRNLKVLDFVGDHLVLKRTRSKESDQVADTPRRLTTILRRGPLFPLSRLSNESS